MSAPPRFYFGGMSPYAWFAVERIDALIPTAVWRPVFAGGLFRAVGRSSWGLDDALAPVKRADCEARAAARGLGPIRWPEGWPMSDILIARALVVADGAGLVKPFARGAMRRAFREGAALEELDVLRAVADEVGLGGARLAARIGDAAVKDAARAATADAVADGVTGVPTVVIGDACFWGDDHLEDAAAALPV